jgi:hypothetical protein
MAGSLASVTCATFMLGLTYSLWKSTKAGALSAALVVLIIYIGMPLSAAQQTHEPFRYDLPGFMSSERKRGEDRNAFTLRRRGEESKRTSLRTKGSTVKGDDDLVRVVPRARKQSGVF